MCCHNLRAPAIDSALGLTFGAKLPIFPRPVKPAPPHEEPLLANSPQARKRARHSVKRRIRNMGQRSSLRTSIKKFLKLVGANDRSGAVGAYRDAAAGIDRAVSKNLHHKNRAARLKKRLNNRLRALNA